MLSSVVLPLCCWHLILLLQLHPSALLCVVTVGIHYVSFLPFPVIIVSRQKQPHTLHSHTILHAPARGKTFCKLSNVKFC